MALGIYIIFFSIIFFIPSILSLTLKKVPIKEAITLNISLGFTWIGWISTIAWCATGDKSKIKTKIKTYPRWVKVLSVFSIFLIELLAVVLIAKK